MNFFIEYIWLDGNYPQKIRSKTKIINKDSDLQSLFDQYKKDIDTLSIWNFDGSSTNQATTANSELLLKPVNIFKDPFRRKNGLIVLAEVYNTDMTSHLTNKRALLVDTVSKLDQEMMWGFEQEYFLYDSYTKKPVGWPSGVDVFPRPQGDYYCAVGGNNVKGRSFVEKHAELCEYCDLTIGGINAEVTLGQWEYQIGPVYTLDGCDQLWLSRYLAERLSEDMNCYIELHPKPYVGGEWNGSGMHINFSTKQMRVDMKNKQALVVEACQKLGKVIDEHIAVYGNDNEKRLTGANETCSISQFKYGIGDRTASIRIPSSITDLTTPGYLEDRRPASNVDPYEACERIIKTICQ